MNTLKLAQIGNSVGVILPKELLAKLGVGKGDTIYAIDTPDGVRLTGVRGADGRGAADHEGAPCGAA